MSPEFALSARWPLLQRPWRSLALVMSTDLTFGTVSARFGLDDGITTTSQYSILVAAVIGGAMIATVIAHAGFLPQELLPIGAARRTLWLPMRSGLAMEIVEPTT